MRALIAALPQGCYQRPWWKGSMYLARALAIYIGVIWALARTDAPVLLILLWPVAGLAISGLFVIGHDAAHGALFDDARWCALVGRLALLPSLHAYAVWCLGHNRIHHVHTACAGLDFVWHPLSKADYDALPRVRKLLHRIEWSAAGAGVYYIRAIWWARMMRLAPPTRFAPAFRRDRLVIWGYAAAWTAAVMVIGHRGTGTIAGAGWTWVKLAVVPWLLWNYFIGATVYLHHIAPQAVWRRPERWTRRAGQLDATCSYRVPRWFNVFAHNIYLHLPHHLDARIPFYHLPLAAAALAQMHAGSPPVRLRLRDYVAITRRCKLYDFVREAWCGYDGVPILERTDLAA